ncbi:MAG: hypothetical protein H0T42_30790 [Deltaproteobacteria bacterium]|nr:hypothetical protein [Deltaproteobacteria bacterium]
MSRLFISLERLEAWNAEGRASLEGDRMTLTALDRQFAMVPAVHFVRATGQDHDPHDLIGRVKTKDALVSMGAEQFASSVIYNDTAYDVVDGFIGDPLPP